VSVGTVDALVDPPFAFVVGVVVSVPSHAPSRTITATAPARIHHQRALIARAYAPLPGITADAASDAPAGRRTVEDAAPEGLREEAASS
jgi:hypothetical protein